MQWVICGLFVILLWNGFYKTFYNMQNYALILIGPYNLLENISMKDITINIFLLLYYMTVIQPSGVKFGL